MLTQTGMPNVLHATQTEEAAIVDGRYLRNGS